MPDERTAVVKGWARTRIHAKGVSEMNRTNLKTTAKRWRARLLATAFGLTAVAGAANAQDGPVNNPPMAGPITGNPKPFSVDLPDWFGPAGGSLKIGGAISGMAFYQDNAANLFPGDKHSLLDLVDGQIFLNKNDGWFQWFVQAGNYTVHSLGVPYIKTSVYTPGTFGIVPQAYIKIVPADNFSIQVGKLPTLVGYETTFSFQNANVERGLLWGQENAVNQGVQVNYAAGPVSLSVSLADGFYSSRLNTISGLLSWTIDDQNILAFAGAGKLSHTGYSRAFTTLAVNNQSIYNIMYTHTSGKWTIAPYLQYSNVPADPTVGIAAGASTYGAAVLSSYAFDENWKIAARAEYIKDEGTAPGASNLLYGQGSEAVSFTITPSYQWGVFFVRPEFSYVSASGITAGSGLGPLGVSKSQTRGILQIGINF